MSEDYPEKRAAQRFLMTLDLSFRDAARVPGSIEGTGQTVNLSSDGILFTSSCPIPPGARLEVAISWPARLDDQIPLQFVVRGTVVAYREGRAVIVIQQHEFRTQRAA